MKMKLSPNAGQNSGPREVRRETGKGARLEQMAGLPAGTRATIEVDGIAGPPRFVVPKRLR